jgi:hypothetical protein
MATALVSALVFFLGEAIGTPQQDRLVRGV